MSDWQPIETAPENRVVMTTIDGRNQQSLKRQGRLWFVPDGSMYVYYTPTHWADFEAPPPVCSGEAGRRRTIGAEAMSELTGCHECGNVLTAEERHYYQCRCERC